MPPTDRKRSSAHAAIISLPNLGPKSAAMLASIGVTTVMQLRSIGAIHAYIAVRQRHEQASLNLLYALVAALEDGNWKTVQRERKLALMLAVEDAMKDVMNDQESARHG